ncbi:hypothetical protein B0H19DRAFT_1383187 [Mycena capillaripes]|nr:hypothetical protein B0H19DRAFT_1383187 [Mycena capillaripes]
MNAPLRLVLLVLVAAQSIITFGFRVVFCAMTMYGSQVVPLETLLMPNLTFGIIAGILPAGTDPWPVGWQADVRVLISAILAGVTFYSAALVRTTKEELALWWRSLPYLPKWPGTQTRVLDLHATVTLG